MVAKTSNDKNVLRAAILAINDGLSSNFNFVMGISGTGMSNKIIILTGLAAVIAGAFSMAMGEWLSLSTIADRRISAIKAAIYSFVMFTVGSIIPIIPFIFFDGFNAVVISAILCAYSLFAVGMIDSRRRSPIMSGIKHVVAGLTIAAITYSIGYLFGVQLS